MAISAKNIENEIISAAQNGENISGEISAKMEESENERKWRNNGINNENVSWRERKCGNGENNK
jgi:hypothetical protein